MSDDGDLIKLYSPRILALAAEIPLTEPLEDPQTKSKVRSPLCGSTVSVEIVIRDGIVAAFAQNVKACALGQAAASVVGANVIGCSREIIAKALAELEGMLTEDAPPPSAPFEDLHVLRPAKDFKNRHASILLALEATLSAFDKAESQNRQNLPELSFSDR